jgi:penicillin-binding protein 1A
VKYIKLLFTLSFLLCVLGIGATTGIYLYLKPELPSVEVLKDVRLQTPMRVYTQDGKLISQFGVKRRIPLKLPEIPLQLIHAVLATEDSRFYEHPGIDPIGMFRALVNLIVTGEKGQGGSTLTMQMARDFFLTRDKTYIRKIKEIFIAWHIEQLLSKDEILELYLNRVELGHRSFGFGAAAQVYYGKDVKELSLAQIATIAGLPKAPSTLNPISSPERSLERRRVVLLRMLDENYISAEEFKIAANADVTASLHGAEIELDAPYLADLMYNEMITIYGKEEAETGGYQVYATAPSNLQEAAQLAVKRNLHDYDERHGYRGPIRQLWQVVPSEDAQASEQGLTELMTPLPIPLDPSWNEDQMLEVLNAYPPIESLQPAVVVAVLEQSIRIFTAQGNYQLIDWDGLDWARSYIDDSKQGRDPKLASDILSAGALIWTRVREDDQVLQLAQLPKASGALVAMNPKNGAIQAVVGGYSFYQSQFNRATQAKRQVGSNIKPFIYSAAIAHGYTLASIINDAPINQWDKRSGKAWRPENSPAEYDGPIRMRVALGKSKNVVSVRLLRGVGLDETVQHLSKFGFERSDIPRDETLALGSGSHTPLEVVTAMATIANGGFAIQPHFIGKITDGYGVKLWQANPVLACDQCDLTAELEKSDDDIEARLAAEFGVANNSLPPPARQAEQVISKQNAFLVSEMMRSALRSNGDWNKKTYWLGTGWRARNILGRDDLHGKTGTTNDSRDTWFSGFTTDLVATSWVGFDDMSRQLGRASRNQNLINKNSEKYNWIGNAMTGVEQGAMSAQPAWIRFMQKALDQVPEENMPIPDDIVTIRIDRNSGKLTKRTDHTSLFEYFQRGTEPTTYVLEDELVDPFVSGNDQLPEPQEIF